MHNYFSAPRVAALYADLNPDPNTVGNPGGGTISYLQLDNRLVVTYANVPEFGRNNLNSLQIEMFFDELRDLVV